MTRSPTDTLIAAMEQADGAQECLVIMTRADGAVLMLGSSDRRVVRLGLIETAKQWIRIIADMAAEAVREGER